AAGGARIADGALGIGTVLVLGPLPHVAAQVLEAPAVGREGAGARRAARIGRAAPTGRAEVGLVGPERGARGVGGGGAGAAGVLPTRLGRPAEGPAPEQPR